MAQGYHYYANSSEAYDLNRLPYDEHKQIIRKRIVRKKRSRPLYKYVGETIAKISVYNVATIAILFVGCGGIALSYAATWGKGKDVAQASRQVKEIQESNLLLEAEISKSYNINEVREYAINELGMSKPQSHQIVHIYAPKQSYVIQHSADSEAETSEPLLQRITDWFAGLFGKAGISP